MRKMSSLLLALSFIGSVFAGGVASADERDGRGDRTPVVVRDHRDDQGQNDQGRNDQGRNGQGWNDGHRDDARPVQGFRYERPNYLPAAPPPPVVAREDYRNRRGYVWVTGEYNLVRGRYVYVAGHYERAHRGYTFVPASWVRQGRGFVKVPGHWARA